MKTKCISLRSFVLACLFSAPFVSASFVKAYDEALIQRLITEFLDVKNCHKSFRQFADEFIHALSGNDNYRGFCNSLQSLKNKPKINAQIVGLTFVQYKNQMPGFMVQMLSNKSKNELTEIIKRRVAQ